MPNYILLEKITVGAAGASSVTFSGIPQTGYTDLVVKTSLRGSANVVDTRIDFNGLTTNQTMRFLRNNSGTAGSFTDTNFYDLQNASGYTASTFSNTEIYIPNYTSANYKSYSSDTTTENNAAAIFQYLVAGLWSSTAAITSIKFTAGGAGTFTQYSTFYLYGVAALGTTPAIAPYATGGDTIMTDGTYWYHAFTSSGTFTPAKGLSCDVLVVAGGGGAGRSQSGGGGAGGLVYSASNSFSTAQTVTVGGGGPAGTANGRGTNGSNSVVGSLTAAVGGGSGGAYDSAAGGSGGSGGGAASSDNGGTVWSGGTATSGQGNAGGGTSGYGSPYRGGGGGGAGTAGTAGYTSSGNGGNGTNTYSTWLNTTGTGVSGYIAGGGGGGMYGGTPAGTGGLGGGGNGGDGTTRTGVAGVANTGSGGGGSDYTYDAGAGGSGLVIIRYAV
jgi:hypothetical protein